jgi:hypothetical protein
LKARCPFPPSGLKLGSALILALMVMSSPIVMLVNPALIAAPYSTDGNTLAPSTIGQGGSDFTTQAALSSLSARPTNNIVNTNSFYDVVFLTASSGAIKTIEVTFPAGTTIPTGAFFNEAEGIGPGTASKSGQTIIYTVTNAVNVPAGTKIRLEFANINNPLQPSSAYQVTVTTRNAANAIIDGPTQSTAYTMKQIGKNAVAESFMKKVTLFDNAAGNARGWNPNGVSTTIFFITEPLAGNPDSLGSNAIVNVVNRVCSAGQVFDGILEVVCTTPPADTASLDYTIINLPPNPVL